MSSPPDRIQSPITGLDRILEPASSAYSQFEWGEHSTPHQILDKTHNDSIAHRATSAALDSSVLKVERKEPRDDSTRKKPPPQMLEIAESSYSEEVWTASIPDSLNPDAIDIPMHAEPESTSSPDILGTHTESPSDSQTDLSFLDLDPTESPSRSSADEAAAAIDLELDEAVKRSGTQQDRQLEDSSIENLYADLLLDDASPSPFATDAEIADETHLDRIEPEEETDTRNVNPQVDAPTPAETPLGSELEDTVFGDRVDLAPEILESSSTLFPSETTESSSSLEGLLSTQRPDVKTEGTSEESTKAKNASDGVDIVRALTDLIPEEARFDRPTDAETTAHTWEALQVNPEAPLTEDDYLLASPEEDLLSGDGNEPLLEQEQNLRLDSTMMEQLESDLDRLEDSQETIALEDVEGMEEAETSQAARELSDEDLDAIFPAFLLAEPSEDAEEETPREERENADIPPSSVEPPPEPKSSDSPPPKIWYLGLDFGKTGLCAVLLNRLTGALYPVYWLPQDRPRARTRIFRLPAAAYVSCEENSDGERAIEFAPPNDRQAPNPDVFLLQHFKSWLNLGLPWCDDEGRWQPQIQLSEDRRISLGEVQRATHALFANIERGILADSRFGNPQSGWPEDIPIPVSPHLPVSTFPLPSLSSAIEQLAGVIVNAPVSASEAYRFNLREALIGANLVQHPEQVLFVEDAIATVLSALPGDPIAEGTQGGWELSLDRPGTTLAIDAGAMTTELVLVNVPDRLEDLSRDRFECHSFLYGGDAIDGDIICQLLLSREEIAREVGLNETVRLPQPGAPDLETRIVFDRWVQSSPLRRSLLEAAQVLKLVLQDRERHTVTIGAMELTVMRRDLEARVLVPYVQQVNRELNLLLSQTGVAIEGIDRALCTGGSASWKALALWLRQKLPNALVVQDLYPIARPTGCSRVAYGLAMLPLYPQVFDELPQQYNDYFLVRELIEVCPDRALSVREIIALLESRGLNVRSCRSRILAILAGQLPLGLVPCVLDAAWLSPSSQQHRVYRALRAAPLFYPENARTYRPNPEQFDRLRQYFENVTVNSAQTWQEPLAIGLEVSKS